MRGVLSTLLGIVLQIALA